MNNFNKKQYQKILAIKKQHRCFRHTRMLAFGIYFLIFIATILNLYPKNYYLPLIIGLTGSFWLSQLLILKNDFAQKLLQILESNSEKL